MKVTKQTTTTLVLDSSEIKYLQMCLVLASDNTNNDEIVNFTEALGDEINYASE